jgi:hypothetical protein
MKLERLNFTSIHSNTVLTNRILLGFIGMLLILLLMSISVANKPPLVIREGRLDTSVIENYQNDSAINEYDIALFIEQFVRRLNFFDPYTIEENIPKALNMMDTDLRDYYKASVITKEFLESIVLRTNKTKTTIKEIVPPDMSQKNVIPVSVTYERAIITSDSRPISNILIRGEMVIKRLQKRSKQYPFGLAVSQFKEIKLN